MEQSEFQARFTREVTPISINSTNFIHCGVKFTSPISTNDCRLDSLILQMIGIVTAFTLLLSEVIFAQNKSTSVNPALMEKSDNPEPTDASNRIDPRNDASDSETLQLTGILVYSRVFLSQSGGNLPVSHH